jgi:hypothetical protein
MKTLYTYVPKTATEEPRQFLLMAAFSGNNDAIEERLKTGNLKQDAVFRAAHKNISDLLKPNNRDLLLICS